MKYTVNRDVTQKECPWIDGICSRGTIVYHYYGCTYGCIASGVAVSLEEGKTPFFELPEDVLTPNKSLNR